MAAHGSRLRQVPVLLLVMLLLSLLVVTEHAAAADLEIDPAAKQLQQQQQAKFQQAMELRSRRGASTRDIRQAVELLKFAGGLLPAASARRHAYTPQEAGKPQVLPVQGFPDLAFNATGRADALRELGLAYQRGSGVEVNHQLALELFRRAADLGDPQAQGMMGMRMAVGLHHYGSFEGASIRMFVPPDEAGALLNYYFGAANGDMFASAALGYRHAFGLGVPKSCWSAVAYYKPVAEAVVQEAVEAAKGLGPMGSRSGRGLPQIERIRLNVHANQGIKPDRQREVLQYYQYSADRGNVDAQTAVGTLLNIGTHGVVRDHAAAAHYLQRAAASGSAEAMAHLGHMYGSGMGVPPDHAEALRYFKKAADKNNGLGLYGLGYMYLSGTGVAQDYDVAFKKLQAAADAGDRDAHFYLGSMYYNGLGMRRKSLSKAFVHFFQAASGGHVQAQFNVAMMHLAGKGTQRSCKPALTNLKALVEKGPQAAALQEAHEAFFRGHHNQALLSYLQAAELGMEVAQSNAAWMLQRGFGHSGPLAAAVATTLYRRSAEQGNVVSLLQLGDCYYYGGGVEQDWVRSAAIYYEAYKLGSPEAMFNLGFMHEFGAGVPKDMSLALRFYNMAKHTNADAALPVYLARAWLRVHGTWEWLRPSLPRAVVSALNWLFELRPASSAASGFWAAPGTTGELPQLGAQTAVGLSQLPAGQGGLSSGAEQQQHGQGQQGVGGSSSSSGGRSSWWMPVLSPALLVWRWDAVMWKLTEAAGLAGLSVNSFMQEYADFGETLLLFVLLAVLLLVLHIRRQRQQALRGRLVAALAQPGNQLMAQQIAAQLGLDLAAQQPQGLSAANAAPAAAETSGQQEAVPAAQGLSAATAAAAAAETSGQQEAVPAATPAPGAAAGVPEPPAEAAAAAQGPGPGSSSAEAAGEGSLEEIEPAATQQEQETPSSLKPTDPGGSSSSSQTEGKTAAGEGGGTEL